MANRHGDEFINCYNNDALNKDYSKHPIQVLIKHSIPSVIVDKIKDYNLKNKLYSM